MHTKLQYDPHGIIWKFEYFYAVPLSPYHYAQGLAARKKRTAKPSTDLFDGEIHGGLLWVNYFNVPLPGPEQIEQALARGRARDVAHRGVSM